MWTLTPTPPYDFALTARAARFLYVLSVVKAGAFRRLLRVGEGLALVEVTSVGVVDSPLLNVRLLSSAGKIDETALLKRVGAMMNTGVDLSPFYRAAQADPVLWETVRGLWGLHVVQADTMFEAMVLTVIEQQIALLTAQRAERWLAARYGDSLLYEGDIYYAFPTPQVIAALTVDDLKPLKITFRRMAVLIDVAQQMTEGKVDLEAMRHQAPTEVYPHLMAFKGVGHWTASWVIMRGLGALAYVGSSDVALQAATHSYFYGLPGRAPRSLVDQTFARFGEFGGAASYYTLIRWGMEKYERSLDIR